MAVMTSTIKVLAELVYERHQAIISALSIVSKNHSINIPTYWLQL